jgi:hypothetical protein
LSTGTVLLTTGAVELSVCYVELSGTVVVEFSAGTTAEVELSTGAVLLSYGTFVELSPVGVVLFSAGVTGCSTGVVELS